MSSPMAALRHQLGGVADVIEAAPFTAPDKCPAW
jgi:hypothetical protein